MVSKRASKKAPELEDKRFRDYELVFVINPEVEGEKFDATMDKVSQFITGRGGTISEMEQWGKRRLAYPIEHFTEGSYVLSRFKLKPTVSKELEANLQISEEILRYLLIRLDS